MDTGFVRIRTPHQIVGGRQSVLRKPKVTVLGSGVCWSGELGTTARFEIEGPTLVSIDLGNDARCIKATVYPNTSYKLEYIRTRWSVAEYMLVEI